ncbi:Carotenoid 9,10(9',10')-cleavage dioxygenase 1 [Acorus gramineus]|uniref:Carotenoid 9,10(9',10')-cleavage dioxygenase 1 n=1 Tax=Acorus gramineus TaxID=55184 RepID=A0AAV9ASY0_ACOGR|nr:Carotenoid 9,10(9',10')-cleavage dioxygenase 1 [Acorus gramineus]
MLSDIEGEVPKDFPEGVYLRNGPNFRYPNKLATKSIFGRTSFNIFQADGMLHATFFGRGDDGEWKLSYKNRFVEADTNLMEKERNRPLFLPSIEGEPRALMVAILLNMFRFGKVNKDYNNTNVFEHAGKVYTVSENHLPYEVDTSDLKTGKIWDINGWDQPFNSHPKKAPRTGEMVIMGVSILKPYYVVGVISADGQRMLHKVDVKLERPTLAHEMGVTENYNIILDYPNRFGLDRLLADKQFIGYERGEGEQSKIGVMPRFGESNSIKWFNVKNHCSFHIINSFEEGDEVIVRVCRTSGSIISGPSNHRVDAGEWYRRAYLQPNEDSEGFDPSVDGVIFSRPFEWRLNMRTGEVVKEGHLTRNDIAMDFPVVNNRFIGLKNKFAYAQVVDSTRSSNIGLPVFKMLAKLCFDERDEENKDVIKVEYHKLEENHFCSGVHFVERPGGVDEDDGWLISYIHDEKENVSKVYIVDAKKFTESPIAKITLPHRVPYGFHGTYVCK